MEQVRQLQELESLNRAFQKAFSHAASREAMDDLLACIGEELGCQRISVFETHLDGTCDNTYEWCREESDRVRELMRSLPLELFSQWIGQLHRQDYLRVRDITTLRDVLPELAGIFEAQGVKSFVASRLAFHGRDIGFFIMENPGEDTLCDASIIMPGMRYIISSMVYHEHLIRRMTTINRQDKLTGTGSVESMRKRLADWPADSFIGICYVEVAGWASDKASPAAMQMEQALIRSGEVLIGLFGQGSVFRVTASEFLVLWDGIEAAFERRIHQLKKLLEEHDLLCGMGSVCREHAGGELSDLIHQAHLSAHDDCSSRLRPRAARPASSGDSAGSFKAEITLHRSDAFFAMAEEFIRRRPGATLLTAVIDLNYFKLYNDIFGRDAGNRFLEAIAASLLRLAEQRRGICGYLGGDNFILLVPLEGRDIEDPRAYMEEIYAQLNYPDGFSPAVGVYVSIPGDPLSAMYDHALIALQEIKGSYVEHIRFYDPDRYLRDRDDKLLLMNVRQSIENDDFLFYLQPQVHEQTGKVVGAEALCRWIRNGTLVSPGQFIPTLEKTGTIFDVDCIVWDKACRWLKSLQERGLPQLPISVNVSRVDFFFTDIAQHFIDLAKKYGIDPALLGIEITESAFADNTDLLMDAVEKLHEAGFQVLMDDFGSGYSSLSMLHSMNLDVLKTDVHFMSMSNSDVKAISIVESVVSMAHMIGMVVITEGIETESQRESLLAMGENYAQGFLFYRPMPVEQFEELLRQPELLGESYKKASRQIQNRLHFRDMVHSGVLSGSLLDNLIGPTAVLKLEDGRLTFMQVNDQYKALADIGRDMEGAEAFIQRNGTFFTQALAKADRHPGDGAAGEVKCAMDGSEASVSARIFMLYTCKDHTLYLMTINPPALG